MSFNINTFKSNALPKGGARPSLFDVFVTGPSNLGDSGLDQSTLQQFRWSCRGASLPAGAVGTIEVPYFGRKIKLAGDRVFGSWQIQVFNDEDFGIRTMFEKWSNALNTIESNIRLPKKELHYKSECLVNQYGKNGNAGNPIHSYKLIGAFPTIIGPIQLDWNLTDQIEIFDVTMEFDYWLPEKQGNKNSYTGKESSDR